MLLSLLMLLYGMTFVGVSCFLLGRATVTGRREKEPLSEQPLSENERKTLRELQNFFQYDGFSQP